MFVRNWMTSPVITLPTYTPAVDAMELMQIRNIRRIPVMDGERLAGILTLGDLQAVLGFQEHSVRRAATQLGDIMTREVQVVAPDDPLERAARVMLDKSVSGLPVVEGKELVGIITESDIFLAFTKIMGIQDQGARVAMTVPKGTDLLEQISRRTSGMSVQSVAAYPGPKGGWEVVVRVRGRSFVRISGDGR